MIDHTFRRQDKQENILPKVIGRYNTYHPSYFPLCFITREREDGNGRRICVQ